VLGSLSLSIGSVSEAEPVLVPVEVAVAVAVASDSLPDSPPPPIQPENASKRRGSGNEGNAAMRGLSARTVIDFSVEDAEPWS
jgi:hypothetical protein